MKEALKTIRGVLGKVWGVLEKAPVLLYLLRALVRSFLISVGAAAVVYLVLRVVGVYGKLETALDLKHNSPLILAPVWAFLALFVICLMVGFLLYFHKYKRGKPKTAFYQALAPAFGEKSKNPRNVNRES